MIAALLLLAQASAGQADLSLFKPLIGACWTAEIGPETRDIHCFSSIFGGAHVRDVHRVEQRRSVVYRGETIYSRTDGTIVFTYVNSLGGSGQGTAEPSTDGIDFALTMRTTTTSAPALSASSWRWVRGGYDVTITGTAPVHFIRRGQPEHAR